MMDKYEKIRKAAAALGEALNELARGIEALDGHLARQRAEDPMRSLTRRLWCWLAGI